MMGLATPFASARGRTPSASTGFVPNLLAEGKLQYPGRRASTIKSRVVHWLWPGRIPLGRLTLLTGDPDVGKSMLTADLVARVTVAGPWPNGGQAPLGSAIMLSAEDSPEDTTVPRLERHGADLDRVMVVGPEHCSAYVFPTGQNLLASLIRELIPPVFCILDPLECLMERIDTHRVAQVRASLGHLEAVAENTGAAIMGILHLNKRSQETVPLYRFGGSIAFVAAARSALLVGLDPDSSSNINDQQRILVSAKLNLGRKPPALGYNIVDPGMINWNGAVERSASQLLGAMPVGRPPREREDAQKFLEQRLRDGPVLATALLEEAPLAGLSEATLRRAKTDSGVVAFQAMADGKIAWFWRLPEERLPDF